MFAVYSPVLAVMEAARLIFLMQLSAVRVAFALLGHSDQRRIIVILLIEGLLAQFLSILLDGLVQLFQIRSGRSFHHHRYLFVLVGLDVGQVRIQNGSLYQAFFYSLAQNLIKATPHNVVLIK